MHLLELRSAGVAAASANASVLADSSRGTESPAPAGSAAQAAESASSADPGGSAEARVGVCTPPTTIAPSSNESQIEEEGAPAAVEREPSAASAPSAPSAAPAPPFDDAAGGWPFEKLADIRASEQLPFGWTKVKLEDDRMYYFNSKAKVCCWHMPQVMSVPDAEPLPEGFEPWELWDVWGSNRSQRVWFNPSSGSVANFEVFKQYYETKKPKWRGPVRSGDGSSRRNVMKRPLKLFLRGGGGRGKS
ncbi:unnamed protein product [Symbiodinium sp. CCMP2592]|nr:unnamed protein product [Symbiodinium sp. CCMP2592]